MQNRTVGGKWVVGDYVSDVEKQVVNITDAATPLLDELTMHVYFSTRFYAINCNYLRRLSPKLNDFLVCIPFAAIIHENPTKIQTLQINKSILTRPHRAQHEKSHST